MKTKKRRWKGELRKPIYIGSIPIEGANEKLEASVEQEVIERLQLLMKHYRIAGEDDYFSLALKLATDYVPGFQIKQVALKLKHGTWGAVIRDNIGASAKWLPHGEWSRPASRGEKQWRLVIRRKFVPLLCLFDVGRGKASGSIPKSKQRFVNGIKLIHADDSCTLKESSWTYPYPSNCIAVGRPRVTVRWTRIG
jgi:hypothetical protein